MDESQKCRKRQKKKKKKDRERDVPVICKKRPVNFREDFGLFIISLLRVRDDCCSRMGTASAPMLERPQTSHRDSMSACINLVNLPTLWKTNLHYHELVSKVNLIRSRVKVKNSSASMSQQVYNQASPNRFKRRTIS